MIYMSIKNNGNTRTYQLHPVGTVHANDEEGRYSLEIEKPYRPGLNQMDQFSHVLVFWWADNMDTEEYRRITTTKLPYAPGVEAGVFASRSEYRPNPIAVTTMMVLDVDIENGIVNPRPGLIPSLAHPSWI
jgi:tRNA (Thr-GGU) A37 N-methylase